MICPHSPLMNNGVVDPCGVVTHPYYYNGFAMSQTMIEDEDLVHNLTHFAEAVDIFGEELDHEFMQVGFDGARAYVDKDWEF